jgi:hypothetical protein
MWVERKTVCVLGKQIIFEMSKMRTKGIHRIFKEEIRDITRKRDTSHVAF